MKKIRKRGFTLVELLVVIAILAVLATVSILGYSSFVKKARISNAEQFASQINNAIKLELVDQSFNSVTELAKAMQKNENDLFSAKPEIEDYHYAYDIKGNGFYLLNNNWEASGFTGEKLNLFVFIDNENDIYVAEGKGYSVFLLKSFEISYLEIICGLDVGLSNVKHIVYDTSELDSKKDVIINTNENVNTLEINVYDKNGESDTINHYGEVNNVTITNCGMSSYHEFGIVSNVIDCHKGRVVVEEGASVNAIRGDDIIGVTIENNGTIESDYYVEEFCQVNDAIMEFLGNGVSSADSNTYLSKYDKPKPYVWNGLSSNAVKISITNVNNNAQHWEVTNTNEIYNLTPNEVYKCEALDSTNKVVETRYLKPTGSVRMINTSVIANVRDLGGWQADGGIVKYGILYRGGELSTVSFNGGVKTKQSKQKSGGLVADVLDFPIFNDILNVSVEVDLRTTGYHTTGDIGSEYYPKSINEVNKVAILHEYYGYNLSDIVNYYQETTGNLNPDNRAVYNSTVEVLRKIIETTNLGKTTYFHCTAGADRTGTIAFMIEGLLGLSKQDMDKEYSLTAYTSVSGYENRTSENKSYIEMANYINSLPGESWTDKFVYWFICAGFTIDELNTFRKNMIDGTPSTLTYPSEYIGSNAFIIHLNKVGNSYQLNPIVGGNPTITYNSSNSNVATINNTGLISAISEGQAKITINATYSGNKVYKSYCIVDIQDKSVKGITLSEAEKTINKGSSFTLSPTINPSYAENKNVTWSSSAPNVASVDQSGKVTAISAGNATITVTTADGNKTATCAVTVTDYKVTSIELNKITFLDMYCSHTFTVNIGCEAAGAITSDVLTWSSSNPTVATVEKGVVKGLSEGTTTITASRDGKTDSCEIIVRRNWLKDENGEYCWVQNYYVNSSGGLTASSGKTAIQNIPFKKGDKFTLVGFSIIDDDNYRMAIYDSQKSLLKHLKAYSMLYYTNCGNELIPSNTNITGFTINNPKDCSLTANTLYYLSMSAANVSSTAGIYINSPTPTIHVSSVSISGNDSVEMKKTLKLTAVLNPTDATEQGVSWSSSNEAVATIDSTGKVTPVSVGTTTITVTTTDGGKMATKTITVKESSGPTNVLKNAIDANGQIYSETGFKQNARTSSSKNGDIYESGKENNSWLSGYIEFKAGDTLEFSNITIPYSNYSDVCFAIYESTTGNKIYSNQMCNNLIANASNNAISSNGYLTKITMNKYDTNTSFAANKTYYLRISIRTSTTGTIVNAPTTNSAIYITQVTN